MSICTYSGDGVGPRRGAKSFVFSNNALEGLPSGRWASLIRPPLRWSNYAIRQLAVTFGGSAGGCAGRQRIWPPAQGSNATLVCSWSDSVLSQSEMEVTWQIHVVPAHSFAVLFFSLANGGRLNHPASIPDTAAIRALGCNQG